jgi:ethanolamine ammonia-lyase large subunit
MLRDGREKIIEHHKQRFSPRRHGDTEETNSSDLSQENGETSAKVPAAIGNQPRSSPCLRASVVNEQRGLFRAPNVMYFETGQGSALSAEAHHGVDQLTLEARAYGVARVFEPFLVNSVVGFIGPEYLYDERQIIRAGLEDHFMGKLLGLPMGCDVCYTNHAAADQNSADNLLMLLAAAGCNYFMGVPAADDVMLNYQSTSFHDALAVRRLFNLKPAPEFLDWLQRMEIFEGNEPAKLASRGRKRLAQALDAVLKS